MLFLNDKNKLRRKRAMKMNMTSLYIVLTLSFTRVLLILPPCQKLSKYFPYHSSNIGCPIFHH